MHQLPLSVGTNTLICLVPNTQFHDNAFILLEAIKELVQLVIRWLIVIQNHLF